MTGLMAQEGLPYGDRSHTYNSRLAQELARWAVGQPAGEAIHDPLFKAYFVDNLNIGNVDVLVEIAEKAGYDPAAAREALSKREFSDAVDADWQRSRDLGLTGVPTFVAGGHGVVGAQPLEALQSLLDQAGAQKRNGGGE